ncbi:ABC-three component system middle component 1 [Clostridium intestinale]|uniref:ABC-three component system middle component 1 n=1 Tax=Clostridium intestinale TaxID=36845 RepID=UPI0028E2D4BE|nr:ABC-three component system middle component 1 [Clostridium intestinale]
MELELIKKLWTLKEEIQFENQIKGFYYTRNMWNENSSIQGYDSHVFICFFQNSKQLQSEWKTVNGEIALQYQSEVDKNIEGSNFYMCCFCKENVELKIQNQIENNTFSAKKYIFMDADYDVVQACDMVENRIFSLNLKIQKKIKNKMHSIILNNFRIYENSKEINLLDKNEKPASLVVIYAKNGTGKTSIFDGVEYALTGEISRILNLVNIDKKDVEKGPVYHNRNHRDKKAFVQIKTDKELIHRNVKKIKENSNDIGKGGLIPRSKPAYLYDEQNQIKKIILQHHKIDSFITEDSSTARYKIWVQGNEELSLEQKEFSVAHKKETEIKKSISNIEVEIKDKVSQIEKLEMDKTSFDKVLDLLVKYNHMNTTEAELKFKEDIDEPKAYDMLINEANIRIRNHETLLKSLRFKIENINTVISYGIDEVLQCINTGILASKDMKLCQERLEQVKEQKLLTERIKRNEIEFNQIRLNFIDLSNMKDYGFDKIVKQKEFWSNSEKTLQNIVAKIDNLQSNMKKLKNENNDIELLLTSKKERNELFEKKKTLLNLYGNYEKKQMELTYAQKKKDQFEIKLVSLRLKKEENLQKSKVLLEMRLPEQIGQVISQQIERLTNIADDESRLEVGKLLEKYKVSIRNLESCQEEIECVEQNEVGISRIRTVVSSYLMEHKETCDCPVCHTSFSDWNSLYQSVLSIRNEKSKVLVDKRNIFIQEQELLQKEYEYAKEKIKNTISKKEKAQNLLNESIIKKQDEVIKDEQSIVNELGALTRELSKISTEIKQTGFMVEIISRENIEKWIQNKETNLAAFYSEREKQRDKNNAQMGEIQKILTEIINKKEELSNQREQVQNDVQLFKYIQFLQNKPESYEIRVDYEQINKKKEEIRKHLSADQEKLEGIVALKLDADEIYKQLELADKKVQEHDKWMKLCKEVSKLSKSSIMDHEREISSQIVRNDSSVELLKQVREENSARTYFQNYKKTVKLCEDKKNKKEMYLEQEKIAHNIYIKKKINLEKSLEKYFSQDGMNEIYKKINPHHSMKNIRYEVDFSEKNEPELKIIVAVDENHLGEEYRPEWYFSTAQLNSVAFSSFFSTALMVNDCSISTILIDDPIGHFDDMNVLGMADLLRSIIEKSNIQIIISTHEERVFSILERKISTDYYSSKFIKLEEI